MSSFLTRAASVEANPSTLQIGPILADEADETDSPFLARSVHPIRSSHASRLSEEQPNPPAERAGG